jgi:hypothetical protein
MFASAQSSNAEQRPAPGVRPSRIQGRGPPTTIHGFYGHEKLEQTVYYIGIDQAEGRAGMDRLEGFLNPSRPGNGVSGPAAPNFTDVPARSQ